MSNKTLEGFMKASFGAKRCKVIITINGMRKKVFAFNYVRFAHAVHDNISKMHQENTQPLLCYVCVTDKFLFN